MRHGVGDETDEDREDDQAEEDLHKVQEPQVVLVGDVVEGRGGDELHRHEHAVRDGVLPENELGGVRAEPVPQHAEDGEEEGRDEREEREGKGAVRRDAILEAVGDLVPVAQPRVGVLDALAAALSDLSHGGFYVISLHGVERGEDGGGGAAEVIVVGPVTRGALVGLTWAREEHDVPG